MPIYVGLTTAMLPTTKNSSCEHYSSFVHASYTVSGHTQRHLMRSNIFVHSKSVSFSRFKINVAVIMMIVCSKGAYLKNN